MMMLLIFMWMLFHFFKLGSIFLEFSLSLLLLSLLNLFFSEFDFLMFLTFFVSGSRRFGLDFKISTFLLLLLLFHLFSTVL